MNSITYLEKKQNDLGNVLIIYPFTYINPYSVLPPIAAEYLQAAVAETGRSAELLDMRFEPDITDKFHDIDLVCLFGYFEDCSLFGKWKHHVIPEVLEGVPDGIPVLAGGTGFADPDQTMSSYAKIDVVIRGNPEVPVMELLRSGTPEHVKNLVYRDGDKVIKNERVIHNLTEHIYPRRHLRNPQYTYHVVGFPVDLIRAAVGCNYRCKFCFDYGKDFDGKYMRWHGRSADSLFQELKETDAPIIGWVDDDMTTDMKTLEDLSDKLISENIEKFYVGTGRIDHVIKSNVEALKKLEKAGFLALSFGVESLKQKTLNFYGKGIKIEHIEKGMRMMQETNILLICNFIFGSPGETEEDMMNMLWFGRKWNADTVVTNRFRVKEGSPMYDQIYDPATGKVRPGMERIEGDELARIKYTVKFAQRTPLRILLTLLKLYKHKGMFVDPLILFCGAIETMTKYTWLEKSGISPLLLNISKKVLALPALRHVTRTIAVLITPMVKAVNYLVELIDKKFGIFTKILPRVFLYLKDGMHEKQRARAQIVRNTR